MFLLIWRTCQPVKLYSPDDIRTMTRKRYRRKPLLQFQVFKYKPVPSVWRMGIAIQVLTSNNMSEDHNFESKSVAYNAGLLLKSDIESCGNSTWSTRIYNLYMNINNPIHFAIGRQYI